MSNENFYERMARGLWHFYGNAASVTSAPMESGPIYEDATYQYFAQAAVSNPASGLSDAV